MAIKPVDHARNLLDIARCLVAERPVEAHAMGAAINAGLKEYVSAAAIGAFYGNEGIWDGSPSLGPYLVIADSFNGAANYARRARNSQLRLPHGTLIAILHRPAPGRVTRLSDVVAAGLAEFATGLTWIYDGLHTLDHTGQPVHLDHDWPASRDTPVYFNLYHPSNCQQVAPLIGSVAFAHNTGCCVGNIAAVLAGAAGAFVDPDLKYGQAAAVYALLNGIRGARICDLQGHSLDNRPLQAGVYHEMMGGESALVGAMVRQLAAIRAA